MFKYGRERKIYRKITFFTVVDDDFGNENVAIEPSSVIGNFLNIKAMLLVEISLFNSVEVFLKATVALVIKGRV